MNFGNPVQNQNLTPYIKGSATVTYGSSGYANFPGTVGSTLNFGSFFPSIVDPLVSNVFVELWVNFNNLTNPNTTQYVWTVGQQTDNGVTMEDMGMFFYQPNSSLSFRVWDTANNQYQAAATAISSTGVWYHVAGGWDRANNKVYAYVNGVASTFTAASGTIRNRSSSSLIFASGNGAAGTSGNALPGNLQIRDFRMIKNCTIPTTNFTPDSNPWRYGTIPSYVTGGTNVFGLYGQYLGSPTKNTFGANTLKTYIQGTASVVESGLGYRALSFPWITGSYFEFGANSPAHFDTRSSTLFMEAWIYSPAATGNGTNQMICAITDASSSDWNCFIGTDNVVHFGYWAPTYNDVKTGTISYGVWNHVAISWNPSTLNQYIFLNGSVSGPTTRTATGVYTPTRTFRIGSETTDSAFNGYIRDLRVIQGATVPTTSFTPDSKLWVAGSIPTYVTGGTNVFGLYGQYLGIQTNYSGLTLLSQLSPSAQNSVMGIFGLRAIIGNVVKAVNIRRSSDNATQDFYADRLGNLLTAPVTGRTLTSWLGGATAYVTTWYDQSPQNNNASQGTSANQPTLANGVINWGAVTSVMLNATNGINTTNFTLVFLVNESNKSGFSQIFSTSSTWRTGSVHLLTYGVTPRAIDTALNPAADVYSTFTFTDNVNFIAVFVGTITGGTATITPYYNGTANTATTNGTVTSFLLQSVNLGGWDGDPSRTLNGTMNNVYMFNSALNTTDRQTIEGYLAWKNNGSGSILPSNHPYYSTAPTFG